MAGGIWTSQNKVRPGAYINFISVPSTSATIGDRGTVAVALPMTWGDDTGIIRITGDELLNGRAQSKVGVLATDYEASLPYRLALSGCFTGLFYRMDTGGTRASATITQDVNTVTATAKYTGTTGNSVNVVIAADEVVPTDFVVNVLMGEIQKETFKVTTIDDLMAIESDYVNFTEATGAVPITAGTPLIGGTNGTVNTDRLAGFFGALRYENFQCLAVEGTDPGIAPLVTTQVRNWMENSGKYVQAVVYNYPAADYEGIISVDQGYVAGLDTVSTSLFPIWVASQTAGAQVNESLTAMVVPGATSIINPVDDTDQDVIDALNAGKFVLTYRGDGAVTVEQDINSFTSVSIDKGYPFRKNRVIRALYEYATAAALIFNKNYKGKTSNTTLGRAAYRGELISLGDELARLGAITDFSGARDVIVLPGAAVDAIVADVTLRVTDAIEKLYLTIHVVEGTATLTVNQ